MTVWVLFIYFNISLAELNLGHVTFINYTREYEVSQDLICVPGLDDKEKEKDFSWVAE